jgi:hypothetical protein
MAVARARSSTRLRTHHEKRLAMGPVVVAWTGRCPDAAIRYRLIAHLHRLAALNDGYLQGLRRGERANGAPNGVKSQQPRANVESLDQTIAGPILISGAIARDPQEFVAGAERAGLPLMDHPEPDRAPMICLNSARLRGLEFKLFDPRALYPGADRLSFVFLETDEAPFLDGSVVQVHAGDVCRAHPAATIREANAYLERPTIQLRAYLEDWIDCLFSWVKFFSMEDLWWHRRDEMRGYDDYHGIFEQLAAARGTEAAMTASYDAVLATFQGHAEHWSRELVY